MAIRLTLWNYRCFGHRPVSLDLTHGLHALVGLNNVGKSTLLRVPYELRPLFSHLRSFDNIWNGINGDENDTCNGPLSEGTTALDLVNSRARSPMKLRLDVLNDPETVPTSSLEIEWRSDGPRRLRIPLPPGSPSGTWGRGSPNTIAYNPSSGPSRYIDMTPLLDAFRDIHDAMYLPASRAMVSGPGGQRWYDISLGSQFVAELRKMQTSTESRTLRERYESTERALARVLGIPDLRINPVPESNVIQVTADGSSRPLHEIGSGIGQFIAAAMSVALKNPTYLLVDEPEIHLHPALQQEYLTLLASNTRKGVVFSTHAVGLARSVASRISVVRHDPKTKDSVVVPLEDQSNPVELLGALQYGAYSTIGLRKVLLVEGTTDCLLTRQWLRLFGKDTDILVLPLGGNSLINGKAHQVLEDLKRFGSPIAAIIDSERKAKNDPLAKPRQDFLDLCAKLDIRSMATQFRATENYFTQRALDSAFPLGNCKCLAPYEARRSGDWAKDEGWRVARQMSKEEVLQTDIGIFLESL